MATYNKRPNVSGKWADKEALRDAGVNRAKIVSETEPVPSTKFTNDDGTPVIQDICKVEFAGQPEPMNVNLNQATIEGLVDAFGGDSANWMGHPLRVEIDKLPGKKYPLYLIPEGYVRTEDANGYSVIVKQTGAVKGDSIVPVDNSRGEPN